MNFLDRHTAQEAVNIGEPCTTPEVFMLTGLFRGIYTKTRTARQTARFLKFKAMAGMQTGDHAGLA